VTELAEKPRISSWYYGQWLVEVPESRSKNYRCWKEALAAVYYWYAHGELPPLKYLWWGDGVPRAECIVNDCNYCTFTRIDAYNQEHEARNPGHYVVVRRHVVRGSKP